MKFAIISSDQSHRSRFWIDPEKGDATSFLNWVDVWQGYQLFYEKVKEEGYESLKEYDVVMMSGHPYYMSTIIEIAKFLKDTATITMYYPEGSIQLFDNSINGFHKEYYQAWNACDIVSSAEEDKISYYESFIRSSTIVRFIHVPMRREMEDGWLFVPQHHKARNVTVVYGDNNPNHPMVALACANRLGMDVVGVDINRGKESGIADIFPDLKIIHHHKLATYPFMRLIARSIVHFYPTEWIGTAREQIACAAAGTPCIGNHDSHTQMRLFPTLGCNIYDVDEMVRIANRLIRDPGYYDSIVAYARDALKFYNLENTKKRFLDAVEDAKAIKKATVNA